MNYLLEKITTVPACQALLAAAKKKKQTLERRARNLGESIVTFRKRLDQLHDESAQLRSSLEIFTGAYGSLSEGKDKVNMNIRIKRLELQQAMIDKKAATYNVGALLVKELQFNTLHSQVVALQDYITEVEQRLLALEAPLLRVVHSATLLRRSAANSVLSPPVLRLPEVRIGRGDYLGSSYRDQVA